MLLIQPIIGGVVILIGFVCFYFLRLIDYATSEFGVTNKRVIIKVRFLRWKNTGVVATPRGSDIGGPKRHGQVSANYGLVTLTGTGGVREVFHNISKPLEFRRQIQG